MILRNRAGQESVREFDFKQLEHSDGDMSLLVLTGQVISGYCIVNHVRAAGNDLQWLYLPAVRRVKGIHQGSLVHLSAVNSLMKICVIKKLIISLFMAR